MAFQTPRSLYDSILNGLRCSPTISRVIPEGDAPRAASEIEYFVRDYLSDRFLRAVIEDRPICKDSAGPFYRKIIGESPTDDKDLPSRFYDSLSHPSNQGS